MTNLEWLFVILGICVIVIALAGLWFWFQFRAMEKRCNSTRLIVSPGVCEVNGKRVELTEPTPMTVAEIEAMGLAHIEFAKTSWLRHPIYSLRELVRSGK